MQPLGGGSVAVLARSASHRPIICAIIGAVLHVTVSLCSAASANCNCHFDDSIRRGAKCALNSADQLRHHRRQHRTVLVQYSNFAQLVASFRALLACGSISIGHTSYLTTFARCLGARLFSLAHSHTH